jgi:protein-S-isoprenylcysteine O-methyltransferase Ste14
MNTKNNPGIYIPPPLIYVAFFLLSRVLQNLRPLDQKMLNSMTAKIIGGIFILMYFLFFITALRRFILSKNTLVTIKAANSLETSGIYSYTRNPMYLSLLFLYSGLSIFFGNWWTFILIPFLIIVIQLYVIKKEEKYLQHAFGERYKAYTKRVRRWI